MASGSNVCLSMSFNTESSTEICPVLADTLSGSGVYLMNGFTSMVLSMSLYLVLPFLYRPTSSFTRIFFLPPKKNCDHCLGLLMSSIACLIDNSSKSSLHSTYMLTTSTVYSSRFALSICKPLNCISVVAWSASI